MPSHPSDTDALLEALFELPPAQWQERLEVLCREHPAHATGLRRRHGLLSATGFAEEPAAGGPAGVPERFGDFRLLRRLGSGGMGMVFAAEQCSLGREVAIKFVRPELIFSPFARARFRREIEAIAQLEHPAIVPILTHDQDGEVPYYVMPLVPGASCEDAIQRLQGRDPAQLAGGDLRRALGDEQGPDASGVFEGAWWQACVRLIRQAALGLDHAHRRGIVHRDVKPSNLLFTTDGRALVVDFGLAHVPEEARITRSGVAPGSPAYMSPEQLRGRAVDGRTDVYSLAVTLHHLLELRHPLPVDDSDLLRAAILSGRRPPLRIRDVPGELGVVLTAAMDLDPERRHATARAFADDLLAVLERRPIGARPLPRRLRVRRWLQRHPTASTAAALGLLLLTATPTLVVFGVARERDRAIGAEVRESRNAYEANIAAVSSALRAGDRAEAGRRLAACPEDQRGFEWRHLREALAGGLREFAGHEQPVTTVAIRGDASWMASADAGGRVLLWQPLQDVQGKLVALPDQEPVEALAVAGDGRWLTVAQTVPARAGRARPGPTLRVVDTATGRVAAERASTELGEQVCMAADGETLLVLAGFGAQELDSFTLQVRRSVRLQQVGAPPAPPCVFDGNWLFASSGRTLQAWRLDDGRGSVLQGAFPLAVTSAAAADRRGTAVFAVHGGIVIANVEPLRVRHIGGDRQFGRIAMDASGAFACAVGADHALRAWDTATGRMTCQAFGRPELGTAVVVASRRLLAVVGGAGGSLALHSLFGGNERQSLVGHSGVVSTLASTRDDTLLSASQEPAVRAWNPTTGAPTAANYGATHWVNAMAIGGDGTSVFTAHSNKIRQLRLPNLAAEGEIAVGGWVFHLISVPGTGLVAVLPDQLLEVDMSVPRVRTSVPFPGRPVAACATPDGSRAMIAVARSIEHWRLSGGLQWVASLPVPGVLALACTGDGRWLFTGEGLWLRRRRVDDGRIAWERPCAREASSLRLLPDESRLVAGHEDGSVSLWNPDNCSCMATLQAGNRRIRSLTVDPAGRWLAAADEFATVTLFRAGGGDETFATRLARADTMAAVWLGDRLRRDLGARASVLAAVEAQQQLDPCLREAMLRVERLRPTLTWEAVAEMLTLALDPAQSAGDYERALGIAEQALPEELGFDHARLCAAFASLRLGRMADALRHGDLALQQQPPNPELIGLARAVRAMALWHLGRADEARAELVALEADLGDPPRAEELPLVAEVRRLVRR